MTDHEEIRAQIEGWLAGDEFLRPNPRDLARHCLSLLEQLDHAKRLIEWVSDGRYDYEGAVFQMSVWEAENSGTEVDA